MPDFKLSPVKVSPYLTVIPTRRPKQKVHTNLGHAKNAIRVLFNWGNGTYSESAIYEWAEDEWKLLYEIPKGTLKKDLPWIKKED